jgi:hypothetical protein
LVFGKVSLEISLIVSNRFLRYCRGLLKALSSMPRTLIAFLVAPLVIAAIVVPYFAVATTSQWVGAIALITLIFSYLGTLVFGIPVYLLFRSQGWVSIWATVATAIIGGWLLWWIFLMLFAASFGYDGKSASELVRKTFSDTMFFPSGVAGAAYGLVFWLIARPDRTEAQEPTV